MANRTLAVDFDGVLHRYSRGWQGGEIYDDPTPGSKEALDELSKRFDLVVFTARTDLQPVVAWLQRHYGEIEGQFLVTNTKPHAEAYIDDRAIRHYTWTKTLETIDRLKKPNGSLMKTADQ